MAINIYDQPPFTHQLSTIHPPVIHHLSTLPMASTLPFAAVTTPQLPRPSPCHGVALAGKGREHRSVGPATGIAVAGLLVGSGTDDSLMDNLLVVATGGCYWFLILMHNGSFEWSKLGDTVVINVHHHDCVDIMFDDGNMLGILVNDGSMKLLISTIN